MGDANSLLLDEPTNHLDMVSVEALADALEDYTGTILLVTDDRHLIHRVATRVLEIHDGHMLNHLSVVRYRKPAATRAQAARQRPAARRPKPSPGAAAEASRGAAAWSGRPTTSNGRSWSRTGRWPPLRPATSRPGRRRQDSRDSRQSAEEARRRRARLRGVEAAILRAEKRLGEIDAELAEPDTYADRTVLNELLDQRGIVEGELQREYQEWEKLVDEGPSA